MNNEQLYEIIGDADEKAVKEAANTPEPVTKTRSRGWIKFAAAAAVVALFAGIGTGVIYTSKKDVTEIKNGKTEADIKDNGNNFMIAAAAYPEMAQYPNMDENADWNQTEPLYDAWLESRKELKNQPTHYKEGYNEFFTRSTAVYLAENDGQNLAYSPLSLYMALGMTAEISEGNTRQQILDALGQPDIETLRARAKSMWQANYLDDGIAKCVLGSSVWMNSVINYKTDTLQSLADNYYASSYSGVPGTESYDKLLREWLNGQTDGLLSDAVDGVQMSPDMVLILASTVNFAGRWMYEFGENSTSPDIFHAPSGDITCDFMHASERSCSYAWGENFTAITMHMTNNGQMRILLPDEGVTPSQLMTDSEALDYMLSENYYPNSSVETVNLTIPKFDISSTIDLKSGLSQMGITDVFDYTISDFTPLTNDTTVYLSGATQSARVIIDEKGCKAAAITIMGLSTGAMEPEEIIDFTADRPFVFEIVSHTGTPLFVGVVNSV